MTATLRKIVEEVKMLNPAEQQELRAQLDSLVPRATPSSAEEEYRRRLLASGLISEIPVAQSTHRPERPPAEVKGKPVSETILEERR